MGDPMIAEVILREVHASWASSRSSYRRSPAWPRCRSSACRNSWRTDRNHLKQLAAQHGYVFYITPGPVYLTNTAYWGPLHRLARRQKALTMDRGRPPTSSHSAFSTTRWRPRWCWA